jgi:L-ascorbate metabolism protein UlaG (beta-lactamase superfamily)
LINSRRFFKDLPFEIGDLPFIDAVFISHSHMDHLDRRSIRGLAETVGKFIVPTGVGRIIERWGINPEIVFEFSWWEGGEVIGQSGKILDFVCTPAYHSAMRAMVDTNRALWASWAFIGSDHRVFFSGDTAYSFHFKQIGYHYGAFDLTILENGQYMAEPFVYHLEPEEVPIAHNDLRGRFLFPHHWGAFDLAQHDWFDPIERLMTAAEEHGAAILTPRIGQTISINENVETEDWWRRLQPALIIYD